MSIIVGAIAGGLAGALMSGGNPKSSIKDRSVLFETKGDMIEIKKRILEEVLDIKNTHKNNLDRELNWNDIWVKGIGNKVFIEVDFIDGSGYQTKRSKIDLILISNIIKDLEEGVKE